MSSFYAVTSANRWLPPSRTPLVKFAATGPCLSSQTSPSGNPLDALHSTYSKTPISATIPYAASALPPPPVVNIDATGGTITTVSGIRYHTFTTSGTFRVISNASNTPISIFAIGGGGGGGAVCGGGGGAGGACRATLIFDPNKPSQLGSYTVTVGAGGSGARRVGTSLTLATLGGATTITNTSSQSITCPGGSCASTGDYNYDGRQQLAGNGSGLGGGGSAGPSGDVSGLLPQDATTYGFPLPAQTEPFDNTLCIGGDAPDTYSGNYFVSGGGGGGLGDAGQSVNYDPPESCGGDGGSGFLYAGLYYGGGGGGAAGSTVLWGPGDKGFGVGGIGAARGGNGASWTGSGVVGGNAAANSGSGGGGAIYIGSGTGKGGNGGSGIAIFSYAVY